MLRMTLLLFGLVGTVLAGTAIVAIVTIPALSDQDRAIIPAAAVASFILAAPLSWLIARSILAASQRRRSTAF